MDFFLCVIGMVFIIEGLPWFAGPGKIKAVIMTLAQLPESYLRRYGFVMMVVGMLLVWMGRS